MGSQLKKTIVLPVCTGKGRFVWAATNGSIPAKKNELVISFEKRQKENSLAVGPGNPTWIALGKAIVLGVALGGGKTSALVEDLD